jgi:hypothetical protein
MPGNNDINRVRAKRRLKIGLILFLLFYVGLLAGSPSAQKGFFAIWWVYIWLIDSLILLRTGSSLLTRRRKEFALLLPLSVCFWLVFELYNLVLKNWGYVLVPESIGLRWIGYTLAFATVLPAVFETFELLDVYGVLDNSRTRPLPKSTIWYGPFLLCGIATLLLPLVWPHIFFPLIWIGFVFLLEPINHYMGGFSLMRQWEEGTLRTLYLLLITGAVLGFFWEFWNNWAITKWVYTYPPYLLPWKLFEMPIEGYIGFPLFAVTCYVAMNTVSLFRQGSHWQDSTLYKRPCRPVRTLIVGLAMMIFCFACFYCIDKLTIASTRPFEFWLNFMQ